MIRSLLLLFGIAYFSVLNVQASDNGKPNKKPSEKLNQVMSSIAKVMVDNYPLIVSNQTLSSHEKKALYSATVELKGLFNQAKPFIKQKSDTYQVSYDLIISHLEKTIAAFNQRNIIYARKRLRSMGAICSSCHTQDTQLRTVFKGRERSEFSSDYDYAEFNYMTRNYDDAIMYYDKFLSSEDSKTELQIIMPLQRMMTIYMQIDVDLTKAKNTLSKYLSLKQHTKKTKKQLQGWVSGLAKLQADHVQGSEVTSFAALKKYVEQYIGETDQFQAEFFSTPEDEVSRVWLRGRLYHYLNSNPPAEEVPAILYWLSICDRTLGYSFNFSFADLYLKDCVVRFPKDPFAKLCFKEYENFVTISYSGSAGVFFPPEVEDELVLLKNILKGDVEGE